MTHEWQALADCTPKAWIAQELPFLQDHSYKTTSSSTRILMQAAGAIVDNFAAEPEAS